MAPQHTPLVRPGITLLRLLLFIAFVCLLLASLTTAFGLDIGPALAWVYGGLAAVALAFSV